ncbi:MULTISPECIES: tRNA (guanosine(37)-N1)-methyltransferase TrmD [Henriciella]|jgi:tRNA (guanine37-N1)-methyltransferase|uniref:tRNA (guanine-N(1)-)-methyltransferase n=1 Tax=Henriciella pelagia TaxID=1977912 RepID=A0ABQ1JLP4_9PROT|nr:tRNA (guanosine(37)-N1)-methyltransferase TrmD [Henriciella pelagia]GGB71669.1 tRNA (guanine-N(1)-)-methyltransferase [Henriciella pelagia]
MAFDVSIITLYPEAFPGLLDVSILGRAKREGIWSLDVTDLRAFGLGKHRQVDESPAGGGAGLVLRPDVAAAAIDSLDVADRPVIYLSPRGKPFTQALARELASGPGMVCFCGRFEGLDERVIEKRNMIEISLGDFVLAGGEAAAQAVVEATVRLLPGVAGNQASLEDESFSNGLLEYPQYTLPREWEGETTPEVLLSGDHKKIDEWRLNRSKLLTEARRADLWAAYLNGQRIRASETDDEHD